MKLSDQITELKNEIETLESTHQSRIETISSELQQFSEAIAAIGVYWSGSWAEYQDYYNNFLSENGDKHIQLNYDSILDLVEKKLDKTLKVLVEDLNKIETVYRDFNQKLITELILIKTKDEFKEQLKLYDKLENFQWKMPASEISKSQRPSKLMTSHRAAERLLSRGIITPPHISLSSEVLSSETCAISISEYHKHVIRLLREIELIMHIDTDEFVGIDNPINNLNHLCDNFHKISRQLLNRHSGRETLIINDEYDVQDLMHALLKSNFDDIRPEEYTPSYAGRNTRIDFLLKKENIVIEVKKTRKTLKDREIGDELLQDIARYKNHPDCNILYCFIYDPQSLIQNPRGLENDLTSESSEKLKVIVSIRP